MANSASWQRAVVREAVPSAASLIFVALADVAVAGGANLMQTLEVATS